MSSKNDKVSSLSIAEQISLLNSTAQVAMQALNAALAYSQMLPQNKTADKSVKISAKLLNKILKKIKKTV